MSAPHRLLLVEDDLPTRQRLGQVIEQLTDFQLVAAVGSCQEARAQLAQSYPDILLTDLGLPDGSGEELILQTTQNSPKTMSLAITVFADEKTVIKALSAGASGYLLKDASAEAIGQALKELIAGGAPISPSIARYLLKRFRPQPTAQKPAVQLTPRETEVLKLVAKGFSAQESAELLKISTHTVVSHVRKIYRKLSVSPRGEAVYEAVQLGLIELEES